MNLKSEIYRKFFHLLVVIFPLAYCYLGKWQSVQIFALMAAIIVPLDYGRRSNAKINEFLAKIFSKILREDEKSASELWGLSFILLAASINFAIFEKEIAITAFLILAISDALAAIVGKSIASYRFYEKTLYGTITFFVSALVILFSCAIYWHLGWWFYIFGIFAVFCVTMFEARPSLFGINDNFVIPIGFSVIMTAFDLVWNYNF